MPLLDALIASNKDNLMNKRNISMSEYHTILMRDLENLLNTHAINIDIDQHRVELSKSPLNYGMPDFSNIEYGSESAQRELCQTIQAIIIKYEPRLSDVDVNLRKNDVTESSLFIDISACIQAPLNTENVYFQARYDVNDRMLFQPTRE